MTALTELDLTDNQIVDVTPLSGLTALIELRLSRNSIQDVASLVGLTALTQFYLDRNQIVDVSPLAGWNPSSRCASTGRYSDEVTVLDLSHNQIQDLTPLNELIDIGCYVYTDYQR